MFFEEMKRIFSESEGGARPAGGKKNIATHRTVRARGEDSAENPYFGSSKELNYRLSSRIYARKKGLHFFTRDSSEWREKGSL